MVLPLENNQTSIGIRIPIIHEPLDPVVMRSLSSSFPINGREHINVIPIRNIIDNLRNRN